MIPIIISTLVLGWIGIVLFVILAVKFPKLAKNNEFGFIHILMAFMYAMWLPIPITLYEILHTDSLKMGMIFGTVYLSMMIMTMSLQTGHIVHSEKVSQPQAISNHLMATLSGPFELMANILKSIWVIFLAVAFWKQQYVMMANLMGIIGILIIYFVLLLIKESLLKPNKILNRIAGNPYFFNIEVFFLFVSLLIFLTFI
ncbi:hypothetical protein [Bacillus sp. MB2021]|uniref:hypothetical protein n=1 Tax=Bacillus sp. MB2021 TaxID=1408303 RepID=UPI00068EBE07|nr:hypothetical protein [Bacillus sp. MB2021]